LLLKSKILGIEHFEFMALNIREVYKRSEAMGEASVMMVA